MMAQNAAVHPDEMVFELLRNGFDTLHYDGQMFFDTDHPVRDASGVEVSVANMIDGADEPWFLLDTSRPVKPLIFQERIPYTPQTRNTDTDSHVFVRDEYVYGIRARVNAGFGLWQMAFGCKDTLNPENHEEARRATQEMRYDEGRIMGIMPTVLVCSPANEAAARQLLKNERLSNGSSNEWHHSAELLVTPYLAS